MKVPQRKKADDERLRRNRSKAELSLVSPEPPDPPPDLRPAVLETWAEYWTSELAKLVDPKTDGPAIRRLFTLYDERERAYEAGKDERLVPGSKDNWVLNPLLKYVAQCDAEIRHMEDRLGMSPRSRLQLGITFGDAMRSMDELNRRLAATDVTEATDPRLSLEVLGRSMPSRKAKAPDDA